LHYTQDLLPDEHPIITLSIIDLQEWIDMHDIDFDILHGVYWSAKKGFNDKGGAFMEKMVSMRSEVREAQPALGEAFKLIMNGIFGTSILKESQFENELFQKGDEGTNQKWLMNVYNSFHSVVSIHDLGKTIQLKKHSVDKTFTACIFGVTVLARARSIMNGLWRACEDSKTFGFYTDTDSLFLEKHRMAAFQESYERVKNPKFEKLIGEKLLQFHSDFSSKGFGNQWDSETMVESQIYSDLCMPTRKKMYFHRTVYDCDDGKKIYGVCHKMKGCTKSGVDFFALQQHPGLSQNESIQRLYETLHGGEELAVPLNPAGAVRFYYDRSNKGARISSVVCYRKVAQRRVDNLAVGGRVYNAQHLEEMRLH
jgi:hypothetical protein